MQNSTIQIINNNEINWLLELLKISPSVLVAFFVPFLAYRYTLKQEVQKNVFNERKKIYSKLYYLLMKLFDESASIIYAKDENDFINKFNNIDNVLKEFQDYFYSNQLFLSNLLFCEIKRIMLIIIKFKNSFKMFNFSNLDKEKLLKSHSEIADEYEKEKDNFYKQESIVLVMMLNELEIKNVKKYNFINKNKTSKIGKLNSI